MQTIIYFTDNEVSIKDREGKKRLSPYFYDDNGLILLGVQVEKAIDLYPDTIFNILVETGESRIEAYLQRLHQYVIEQSGSKNYLIRMDSHLKQLKDVTLKTLHGISVESIPNKTALPLSCDSEIAIRNALSVVIANRIARTCKVSGSMFHKLKRIVYLRIELYRKELLEQGRTTVKLKVVDERRTVLVIDQDITDEIPAIARLLELYKHPHNVGDRLGHALYEIYDDNYKVTFISPFSFGKSTLINGLLGEKMLNMDIRAETAIVTKVVSADENRLFVKYADNRIVMHSYENEMDLQEKLAGLTGVRSQDTPEEVQIHHTLEHLPAITIIDAPGLNSRHTDHNEKASKAFQISDLILFMISPAHIGEANFSRQIKEYLDVMEEGNKKYGVVLSKLDLHSDDYGVIMKELEIVLKELDPSCRENKIFFVSGYFALYGKLLRDNKIDMNELRRSHGIFVMENEEILSGRAIERHHFQSLLEFSQIGRLEHFIKERGEPLDSNEFDLDRGKRTATQQHSYA